MPCKRFPTNRCRKQTLPVFPTVRRVQRVNARLTWNRFFTLPSRSASLMIECSLSTCRAKFHVYAGLGPEQGHKTRGAVSSRGTVPDKYHMGMSRKYQLHRFCNSPREKNSPVGKKLLAGRVVVKKILLDHETRKPTSPSPQKAQITKKPFRKRIFSPTGKRCQYFRDIPILGCFGNATPQVGEFPGGKKLLAGRVVVRKILFDHEKRKPTSPSPQKAQIMKKPFRKRMFSPTGERSWYF